MLVPLQQDTIQASIQDSKNLPPLGWIAEVDSGCRAISIQHGSRVEHGRRWIVEGVWDGPFGATFDQCAHLFGSGVKVGNESITFVPSCALVDRLVWADHNGALIVSNSLALLLAKTGARLISGESYDESLYAVGSGIDSYDDEIPTTAGPVHQLYYHNLVVKAGKRLLQPKDQPREIASYEQYESLVLEAIDRLRQNIADPYRRIPVQSLATISRGYDSTAVCTLARNAGLRRCYTARRSNSLVPAIVSRAATDDDGTVVAEALGLEARALEPSLLNELYFLAGSDEPEFIFDQLAADTEAAGGVSAVFTGYHGDMLWRLHAFSDHRATQIIRHDMSGLNLCEVRLKAGFFNVPLTFLFARSQASIGRISRSDEMKPWRTGTDYDRPIPRRLLTTAGVDGSLFGQRKKAVVQRPDLPRTRELREDFLRWLQQNTRISPKVVVATALLNALWTVPVQAFKRSRWRLKPIVRPADIRARLYVWAVNRLAAQYASRLSSGRKHGAWIGNAKDRPGTVNRHEVSPSGIQTSDRDMPV